ncbi:ABC transporter ATP-binding protein [Pediococcus acidilactici]|uniref:ABC transporter ATP-binding protein n=2 Tax=Lactobacillales TaxID=186826 RepID=UPI00132B9E51|nr:ABC transporter ATP-binding protein [Pediococcus acidilactici]KAF0499057.1 ATP-binding cassette domain-containing protein [Pediococcus acidilactici]KAF0540015.1 ATP-binding cassette domain-containing protein [Pediococcus acidilactici]KAF0546939.1 ATP-binding cassette domain-containing protein [Pediococcus acidilactici]
MQLKVEQLQMSFKKTQALQNISFTVENGGLIGLIGPNGAGKSTLMKIVATLLKPSAGDIILNGVSTINNPQIMRQQLGYMPQQIPYIPQLSALEYLRYLAALKGLPSKESDQQIQQLLERLHLRKVQRQSIASFSSGMRQRVGLAAALLGNPQIIIVDEPSAGLDPIERIGIRNLLSELAQDRIVILSTHIVSDIEAVASKLLLLRQGQLVFEGTPEKLIKEAEGKVWEYVVPAGKKLGNEDNVSEMRQSGDGIHVRVVADEQPNSTAKAIIPTLEDASLVFLEGK